MRAQRMGAECGNEASTIGCMSQWVNGKCKWKSKIEREWSATEMERDNKSATSVSKTLNHLHTIRCHMHMADDRRNRNTRKLTGKHLVSVYRMNMYMAFVWYVSYPILFPISVANPLARAVSELASLIQMAYIINWNHQIRALFRNSLLNRLSTIGHVV